MEDNLTASERRSQRMKDIWADKRAQKAPQITLQEPPKQNIMQTETVVEVPVKKIRGLVSIKPYVSGEPKMGLEKYEEVLFPNTEQMDIVMCYTKDNIKTYKTGLNEFASEIQSITDQKEKVAKITEIRRTVAWLENTANANFKVSPKDCMANYGKVSDRGESLDTFWENVTMFQSVCVDKFDARGQRIPTYWDRLSVILNNEGRSVNLSDPHDMAIYHVIMANGFGLIANSLEQAMREKDYNFYLHRIEDVAAIKTEYKKLRNKAGGYLDTMLTGDNNKLFFMAKMVAPMGSSKYYMGGELATPLDQLYDDLCNYIDGKSLEKNSRIAVDQFLKFYSMPERDMQIRCIAKDAMELQFILLRSNGQFYCRDNSQVLGKNIDEVVANLSNPINEETKDVLTKLVTAEWRK